MYDARYVTHRINTASVIPAIFASTLLFIAYMISIFGFTESRFY